MNVDITNHLVPWTQVKEMLKGAWDEGADAAYADAQGALEGDAPRNPYQEDE